MIWVLSNSWWNFGIQLKAKQEMNWEKLRKVDLLPKLPIFSALQNIFYCKNFEPIFYESFSFILTWQNMTFKGAWVLEKY